MPRPLMALFIEFLLALPAPCATLYISINFTKNLGIHAISVYRVQLPSSQRAGSVFFSERYA